MRNYLVIVMLLGVLLLASGCTERQRQDLSHWKSDLIGLKRTITLYANNGKPIKSWTGRYKVELIGSAARFIHEGEAVIISGTYIIEEQ